MFEEKSNPEYANPVIHVPRWRVFAYRAAGWTISGGLADDFVEMTWACSEKPVFLPLWLEPKRLDAVQHASHDERHTFFESRLARRFR